MKKLKYLLFILLCIPCMVKADMGAPSLKPYKMIVTNPDGIDYYETDEFNKVEGHLNKNDQFTVTYEYDGSYSIDINKDNSYYLSSLDGTMLVKDSVDPVKDKDAMIKKLKTKEEVIVYNEDGVNILEGPAEIYKKVGYAPKGTKLKYEYYISEEDSSKTYIYVEFKGKKGWVNVLDKKILFPYEQDFIAMDNFKIKGTTIPKNTIIRSHYTFDGWSRSSLIEYNGCEDIINNFDETSKLLTVYKYNATAKRNFKVTTEADGRGVEVITIPENANFLQIASYSQRGVDESQMYIEYQGKRGWIKLDKWEEVERDDKELENATILEDTSDTKEEKKEEPVKDVAPSPKKEDKKEDKKTTKKSADDYTLTYVIIGASVAVVALVTIVLINKKSKKKNNSNVVEEKNKEQIKSTVETVENKEQVVKEEKIESTRNDKICPNCGAQVEEKFCGECGTKVE